jgi:hypothetical protein
MSMMSYATTLSLLFAAVVVYKVATMRMALMMRDGMAESVRDIMLDDSASDRLKAVAMTAFHASMVPATVLRGVLPWNIRKHRQCAEKLELSEHERSRFDDLIRHHFLPINIIAGLHWYILFFLVLAVIAVVAGLFARGRRAGVSLLRSLEDQILNPRECWHN